MKFYSLYSKSQELYNVPFVAAHGQEAIAVVSKMVSSQGDMALMSSLDDLRLVEVGDFEGGKLQPVTGCEPFVILDDLHIGLPLPPTIKSRLAKFYEIKDEEKVLDQDAEAPKKSKFSLFGKKE